jgi:hypothetical protein
MPASQKTYRIYCYDGVQRTLSADLIEAPSDEAAIAMVETLEFGTKCEIWESNRMVAQLEALRRQA